MYIRLALFALLCFALPKVASFCKKQTDDFTILSISSQRASNQEQLHALSQKNQEEIAQALSQKYHYFVSGGQAFVFFSDDGKYVLKFFRQSLFGPPSWLPSWMQKFYPEKKLAKRKDKLSRDFASYKLAFDELKEETALVLVHLDKTPFTDKKITLIDNLKIAHTIDLNQFDFILQKKAELVYPTIDRLMHNNDTPGAKKALDNLLGLLSIRCKKGIADSIPDLDKNFAYLDGNAVQIDIGRFCKDPSLLPPDLAPHKKSRKLAAASKVDVPIIKDNFKEWLGKYPELLEHFDSTYQKMVQENAFSF